MKTKELNFGQEIDRFNKAVKEYESISNELIDYIDNLKVLKIY